MTFKTALGASLLGASTVLLSAAAANATVLGSAYFVPEAEAQNAVIGFAHGAPNATFSVPSPSNPACGGMYAGDTLCFDSRTTSYTLGGFLTGGGATILTGTAPDLAHNLDDGTNGTIIEFKGTVTVTNGEVFSIAHDDGLQLMIGAVLVLNDPGPTSPTITTATYNGPSGTFAFDLVYGECCGAPAVLAIQLPLVSPVPEPTTLALLGSALVLSGLGAAIRRRRKDG